MSETYTSAQLGAKKVPELKAILNDLKLPTTGVKAELTARILEHQEKSQSGAGDAPAAESSAAAAAPADPVPAESGDASSKQDAPAATEAPAAAETTSTAATEKKEDAPALPAATDKSSEAEKRAARLKRFGAPAEELAKLDRAARFGENGAASIDDSTVSKLDSELSNKRMRKDPGPKAKGGAPDAKRPKNERTESGAGKPQSKGKQQQQQSTNGQAAAAGGKPKSAGKPAPAKLDPEEEERRRKRAERFNAAS